jgi:hypothetical protein
MPAPRRGAHNDPSSVSHSQRGTFAGSASSESDAHGKSRRSQGAIGNGLQAAVVKRIWQPSFLSQGLRRTILTRPLLEATLAALPAEWTILLDRRSGGTRGPYVGFVLRHPDNGVALADLEDRRQNSPSASGHSSSASRSSAIPSPCQQRPGGGRAMRHSEYDPGAKDRRRPWNAGRKLGGKRALKPQQSPSPALRPGQSLRREEVLEFPPFLQDALLVVVAQERI